MGSIEEALFCMIYLYIYIYTISTPNLGLEIAVPGREKKKDYFKESRERVEETKMGIIH